MRTQTTQPKSQKNNENHVTTAPKENLGTSMRETQVLNRQLGTLIKFLRRGKCIGLGFRI
jgi:hypothetical protein